MKNSVLFSVIIPVYNIENYIDKCVNSVLKQNFDDYEIILVDDDSIDKSPVICDKYKETSNKVKVIHKKNEGVSAARYDGIKFANGKYILCIDGDDWITTDCLNHIAKLISETNAEIVCYGMYTETQKGYIPNRFDYREGFYDKRDIINEIFPYLIQQKNATYFPPSLCCKAIKIELLKKYMLVNPLATIGEDGATVIPCVYNAASLYITQRHFYYYRYNDNSATKSKSAFNWKWPQIVSEHISNNIDIDFGDFREQLCRKTTHDVFSVVASQFYRNEPYKTIVRDISCHLDTTKLYADSILDCSFKNSIKAFLMTLALRRRLYFLIYLYSKR